MVLKWLNSFTRDKERQRRGIGEMGQGFDSGQEWRGSKDRRKESKGGSGDSMSVSSTPSPTVHEMVSRSSHDYKDGVVETKVELVKVQMVIKWDGMSSGEIKEKSWKSECIYGAKGVMALSLVPWCPIWHNASAPCPSNTYNSIQNRSKVTRALALVPWRLTRCCGAHYSA
ncbi:hypothetical protein Scep_012193 [Stephania cephalantha]|uniref:Uncharacterized protein n=1 Tax=Stephania cephalantha TaxID=152367 RepID=A0AAP0JFJ9_9MAGN